MQAACTRHAVNLGDARTILKRRDHARQGLGARFNLIIAGYGAAQPLGIDDDRVALDHPALLQRVHAVFDGHARQPQPLA